MSPSRRIVEYGWIDMRRNDVLRCLWALVLISLPSRPLYCNTENEHALSDRVANYTITARLDPKEKTIEGEETLRWRNTSADTIRELRFHLYLNAFKNSETLFMKGTKRRHGKSYLRKPGDWGWIKVDSAGTAGGGTLAPVLLGDGTVMSLSLPDPLPPGDSISVGFRFHARFPKLLARSGFAGDFFMAGQWYPKIGVYGDHGWSVRPYHRNSEYFADFGSYDVSLSVPGGFIVGASGRLVSKKEGPNGLTTFRYVADDVHNFAWTASPDFHVAEDEIEGIKVRILYQPHHEKGVPRFLSSLRAAISFLREKLGPYPYETLTVVDPPPGAFGAMGVEYPTLINAATFILVPEGLRFPEETVIHEFTHQYWYGMVANNEIEEAWLDEGFTSYYTARIMEEVYGRERSFLDMGGLRLGAFDSMRRSYQREPDTDPVVFPSYSYFDNLSYGVNSYSKPAFFLRTMENLIGQKAWDDMMRRYFEQYRFKHPTSEDFVSLLKKNTPASLDGFIDRTLHGTGVLDFAVTDISVRRAYPRIGVFGDPDTAAVSPPGGKGDSPTTYRSEVVVRRKGELSVPVDVEITFDDGTSITKQWDAAGRWKRYVFEGARRVEAARIDPDGKLALEITPLDNWRSTRYQTRGVTSLLSRILFYLQEMVLYASSLI